MEVKDIQAAFRQAGAHVPKSKTAQAIANALPFGAMALGVDEADVLDTILKNRENGAAERLVQAHRIYQRELDE